MEIETLAKKIASYSAGKAALWILSLLYQTAIILRHLAYQYRLLKPKKAPAVVISVGGIVAGGTGKTPLTHFLAHFFAKRYSVAVVSRGYRSQAEKKKEPTLVSSSMKAEEVGDEPLWLAQKLPQVQVWVGVNRYASIQKAAQHGAELIILDDGFQHRALHRDFDVVAVSGESPLGSSHFLPRGFLRDLPSRLASATLLATIEPIDPDFQIKLGKYSLRPSLTFEKSVPSHITQKLRGKKVALFCAIANPHRFIQQIETMQAKILTSFIKPDHAPFSLEELEMLAAESQAEYLVCTEKDFVKLPSIATPIPLIPIPCKLTIKSGHEAWKQFTQQVQHQVNHDTRVSSCSS